MQNQEKEHRQNSWLALLIFAGTVGILILGLYFLVSYFQEAQKKELLSPQSPMPKQVPQIAQNTQISPQSKALWQLMMATPYSEVGKDGFRAVFSDSLKNLEGKEISLQGFMYPLSESKKQARFMLSYYPVQSCFFCGMAGPESVIEINARKAFAQSNQLIGVKGKLKLNRDDPHKLFYSLEQAKPD